jgi:CRISPR-associated DxTHG motif protein
MAKYIIAFLGAAPSDKIYQYEHEGKAKNGRVFPEALRELVDFDRMYVCVTEKAKEKNWQILASDDRIEAIDIPDGKNPEELWEIFDKVTNIFHKDDQVIFDITHAFRSLPFLTFLFAAYLKVAKTVKIVSILYGAIDQGRLPEPPNIEEIEKIAPVIEIGEFVSMLDWMSATQRFVDLGDGNGLVKLLETVNIADPHLKSLVDDTANAIAQVSDALIYILPIEVMSAAATLQRLIPKLKIAGKTAQSLQPFLLLCDEIQAKYHKLALDRPDLPANLANNLQRQLAIIDWYQTEKQQVKAIILSRELFVSIMKYWLREGDEVFDGYEARKNAEQILNRRGYHLEFDRSKERNKIVKRWDRAKKLRNSLAHLGMDKNCGSIESIKLDINSKIDDIKLCLQDFLRIATARNI